MFLESGCRVRDVQEVFEFEFWVEVQMRSAHVSAKLHIRARANMLSPHAKTLTRAKPEFST